jgi:CheY-like chemotaxis protein
VKYEIKIMNDIFESNQMEERILVVDDEPANISLFKNILETEGYINIITTLDPVKVIPLHLEHDFNLILLDINMPGMDGYEVLKQLQNSDNFNDTKVVATSADVSPGNIKKALDSGFTDYITKPMKIQTTLEIVDKALHRTEH